MLTARANTVVSTDELIEALWSDDLPQRPSAALHSQVARLRRLLDAVADAGCRLVTSGPGYALEIPADDLDLIRFSSTITAARSEPDPGRAAAQLADALSLWRGRPFGGLDIPALEPDVVRLEEMHAAAVETCASALLDAGRCHDAVEMLEPFVLAHPLREGARAVLMRALDLSGRHADALRQYEQHRVHLAEELGLEPGVALQRLHVEILRHDLTPGVPPPRTPAPLDDLSVRYATLTAGTCIGYATIGSGAPVVAAPAWVSSLDIIAAGRDPRSSVLERLAHHVQLVLYDRPGTGVSRGPVADFSADAAGAELISLVEHLDRPVALLAMSSAGPAAILAAARRPELITHLVLFGTYADGHAAFPRRDVIEATLALGRAHWPMAASLIAGLYRPGASPDVTRHIARVLREAADTEVTLGYLESMYDVDVSHLLAEVRCPSLVLHYRGDLVVPFAGGQQLAAGIPAARFVPLDGNYHLPDVNDLDRIVAMVSQFVDAR